MTTTSTIMRNSDVRRQIRRVMSCDHDIDPVTLICARCEWTNEAIAHMRRTAVDAMENRVKETAQAREILMEFLPAFIAASGSASLEFKRVERGYEIVATQSPGTKHARYGKGNGHLPEAIDMAMRYALS